MTKNETNGDGVREIIRSQPSRNLSFVRFCNATQRKVEVIWINYEGARVKYKTLEPEEFFDVNTYVAHPWVFQDAVTRESLNVNSKSIYEPGPWYEVKVSYLICILSSSKKVSYSISHTSQICVVAEYIPRIFNRNE